MLKAMAANHATAAHADWISANAENKEIFHDFTHGGVEVVLRRMGQDVVAAEYPAAELEYLAGLGVEAYIRIGCELLLLGKNTEGIQRLYERVQAAWQRPPLAGTDRNRVARVPTGD